MLKHSTPEINVANTQIYETLSTQVRYIKLICFPLYFSVSMGLFEREVYYASITFSRPLLISGSSDIMDATSLKVLIVCFSKENTASIVLLYDS